MAGQRGRRITALGVLAIAVASMGVTAIVGEARAEQAATGAPLSVRRVDADPAGGTLTIHGASFALRSLVTLDLVPLTLHSVTDDVIVAAVPIAMMPAGRYVLTVSRGSEPGDTATTTVMLPGVAPAPTRPAVDDPSAPLPLPSATDAAAIVGDRVITIADADREWQRADAAGYLALQRRVYDARHRATRALVTAEIVAREAASRGLTSEALLASEVPKRRVPLPDVAVAAVYQSLGERARGVTLDELRPAIRAWLAEVTEPELATMTFVEELIKVSTRAEFRLTAPRTPVRVAPSEPSLGPPDAPVQVVVFGDFQSREYAALARAFPRILETFGARLRLVFKHLPTGGLLSDTAARGASCANLQGRFWVFHDAVVTSPGFLDTARLKRIAGEAGIARAAFDACLDGETFHAVGAQASAEAGRYAVTTTASVLVNGVLAPPPPPFLPPFEYLQRLIEEALAGRKAVPGGR
jgi:protein-disulfide isomerase